MGDNVSRETLKEMKLSIVVDEIAKYFNVKTHYGIYNDYAGYYVKINDHMYLLKDDIILDKTTDELIQFLEDKFTWQGERHPHLENTENNETE